MAESLNQTIHRSTTGHVVVLIGTILSLPCIPIALLAILIGYLVRTTIKTYVKYFRPEYGKILPIRSLFFHAEFPGIPSQSSMFNNSILKGSIDFNELRNDILVKVNQRNSEGDLKYPELQQIGASFAGYSFWKWDKHFDINNHVHLGYKGCSSLSLETLNILTAQQMHQPYVGSPWEVYVFPDFKFCSTDADSEPRSAVVVRFNHALLDGYSLVEILAESSGIPVPTRRSKNTGRSSGRKLTNIIINLLMCPYTVVGNFYDTWDERLLKVDNSDSLIVRYTEPIPIWLIKGLKEKFAVSFGVILMAAYTAGLRKLMLENKIKLPVALHSFMPMPMLGHSDKLRNRIKPGQVIMPVGIADPVERLNIIQSQQQSLSRSRLSSQLYYFQLGISVFPTIFLKSVRRSLSMSGSISNFHFPNKSLSYAGHDVEHMFCGVGVFYGKIGISITAVSFEDSIIIETSFIRSAILSGDLEVLQRGVLDELGTLSDIASSRQTESDVV